MKYIAIFILFFILGCGLVAGYFYLNPQQNVVLDLPTPITTKFSLANAPEDSLKGTIASMSGVVNWQSRTANTPTRLKAPRSIQQGEELGTGKNGKVEVLIQSAEAMVVNPNSQINFIQMLPVNLVISQDLGIVTYQNTGKSAMTVQTFGLITSINYGIITINLNKDTHTITVDVEKGSATEGYEDSQNNSNVVTVNAGQQFVFDDTTQAGAIE